MSTFYRSILAMAAVLITTLASADGVPLIYCEQCRGVEYPQDFGNFALNQTYGPGSTEFEDELIIVNSQSQWVHVDLSFVLAESLFWDLASLIGFDMGFPTGDLRVDITTPDGTNYTYDIDLDIINTMGPLPVGEAPETSPGGTSGGSGSGSSVGGEDLTDIFFGGDYGSGGSVGGGYGSGDTGGVYYPNGIGGSGGGSGYACTSAGEDLWFCVSY